MNQLKNTKNSAVYPNHAVIFRKYHSYFDPQITFLICKAPEHLYMFLSAKYISEYLHASPDHMNQIQFLVQKQYIRKLALCNITVIPIDSDTSCRIVSSRLHR